VKKRELEISLKLRGWWMLREGGHHEIWTNGKEMEPVPRHREIPELLAKKILRKAEAFPGQRGQSHEI
jgi:mRNA interferase HicA